MQLNTLELTKNGVQIFLDNSGIFRKWYCNNLVGRAALATEQPPEIVAEVMAVWGDTPTMPDYVPEPTPEQPEAPPNPTIEQRTAALESAVITMLGGGIDV